MFKLKIYCDDGGRKQYWDRGVDTYETYDKALIACFESAVCEAHESMESCGEYGFWFEVEPHFEVTDACYVSSIVELGTVFPVAVVCYDHAPWDRENDCDIKVITGYMIEEVE